MHTVPHALPWVPPEDVVARLTAAAALASTRRSVRQFATTPVPRAAIEAVLRVAGSAPSGAHRQPWHFVAVSDPVTKGALRAVAEAEEAAFYAGRASPEWLAALAPLGTDAVKTHLTDAPWVIVVFCATRGADGLKNYYAAESVGIAVGMLLSALHAAGLAALTHTPAPMEPIRRLLGRPPNERPFALLPVGYPAADCRVPDLERKPLDAIATFR